MVAANTRSSRGAIGGLRNNEDSKRKGQSFRDGVERRARRGQPNGGPAGYGYRWRAFTSDAGEPRKRRVIDQREAAEVKRRIEADLARRDRDALA